MFREKINIIVIILTSAIISSCSVSSKSKRSDRIGKSNYSADTFLKEVNSNNISRSSFRIDKVRVVAQMESGKHRFSGNLKYHKEGKLIFSARAIAGIELARIYIDRRDVVFIDRINRIYYGGETDRFLIKYGLSWNDIVVIFGDLPEGLKSQSRVICLDGSTDIKTAKQGVTISYTIDCVIHKLINIKIGNENDGVVKATYSGIKTVEGASFPGEVKIEDSKSRFGFELYYDRYGKYDGNFGKPSQPKGYEIESLL